MKRIKAARGSRHAAMQAVPGRVGDRQFILAAGCLLRLAVDA
nr:hypothetical protein [Candidatus Sigynarchaeota archaeon]